MSHIELNKQLIHDLFRAISANDAEGIKALATPDGYFETQGSSLQHHYITVDRLFQAFELIKSHFPNGLDFTIKSMIMEDNRGAAEVEFLATHTSGELYNNDYVFLFSFEGNKIHHIKEFVASDMITRQIISDDFMNSL